jgi:biopolymer transport protein ExbB
MIHIDTAYFHEVCINVLYGCLVLLTFVLLERLVYFAIMRVKVGRVRGGVNANGEMASGSIPKGNGLFAYSVREYVDAQKEASVSRERIEDLSTSVYMHISTRITARLWVLDTIVTAAPLLGLLGTILGIMDTFQALSAGGISDPAAVSRGIAAALLATAIGIGTALYGLLAHNVLHRIADVILEEFKGFLLAATRI